MNPQNPQQKCESIFGLLFLVSTWTSKNVCYASGTPRIITEFSLHQQSMYVLASFPGSPSFRAIIPRMTFDPGQRSYVELLPGQRSYVELLRGRRESLGLGQRSYVELLRGRRESLGTRLCMSQ